jgi:hypothetical protein
MLNDQKAFDSTIPSDHQQSVIPAAGDIHTVDTLSDIEPGLNHGGIRWTIHQHRDALLKEGAIFYCGKKLLIDRPRFIAFIKRNSA